LETSERSTVAIVNPVLVSQNPHPDVAPDVVLDADVTVRWTENSVFQRSSVNYTENSEQLDFLRRWNGAFSFGIRVKYLRNFEDLKVIEKLNNCTSALYVLHWLTAEMSKRNSTLMVAYGQLIHIYRENDFLDKNTGEYFDDDIDLWAAATTAYNIIQLESELFQRFGWTVRVFISGDGYVVLLQLMASCGHAPIEQVSKAKANEPALEIYVLQAVPNSDGRRILKDMWQGTQLSQALIYPSRLISVNATGVSHLLHLQVPNQPFDVLTCLFGNWTQPSQKHVAFFVKC